MSLQWVTHQILRRRREPLEPARYNPRPKGVMLPGSSTHAVLTWLDAAPAWIWWTRWSIRRATGLSRGSVDWALIYLAATGRIEVLPGPQAGGRGTRYRVRRDQA